MLRLPHLRIYASLPQIFPLASSDLDTVVELDKLTHVIPYCHNNFFREEAQREIMYLNPEISHAKLHFMWRDVWAKFFKHQETLLKSPRAIVQNESSHKRIAVVSLTVSILILVNDQIRVVDREASARMSNIRKSGGCLRKGVCFGGWRRLGVGRFILGTFHWKQWKETAKEKRKTEDEEENLVTGTRRRG
nr:hypothetical protein Iba_chr14fCG7600 [Ipomoea batatas]